MNTPTKCPAAVALGKMRKGIKERKSQAKRMAVCGNLIKARAVLAEQRSAAAEMTERVT